MRKRTTRIVAPHGSSYLVPLSPTFCLPPEIRNHILGFVRPIRLSTDISVVDGEIAREISHQCRMKRVLEIFKKYIEPQMRTAVALGFPGMKISGLTFTSDRKAHRHQHATNPRLELLRPEFDDYLRKIGITCFGFRTCETPPQFLVEHDRQEDELSEAEKRQLAEHDFYSLGAGGGSPAVAYMCWDPVDESKIIWFEYTNTAACGGCVIFEFVLAHTHTSGSRSIS